MDTNTRQYRRLPSQLSKKTAPAAKRWSDRRFTLTWLIAPVVGVLLAFIVAIAVTALGEMTKGTPRFYFAALSYTYLLASMMFMPAYVLGVGWYWWFTRSDEQKRIRYLWWIPVMSAVWGWFPAILFPINGEVGMGKLFVMMAGAVLALSLFWVIVVRSVLYFWRKM